MGRRKTPPTCLVPSASGVRASSPFGSVGPIQQAFWMSTEVQKRKIGSHRETEPSQCWPLALQVRAGVGELAA